MYTSIDTIFYQQQLAVLCYQIEQIEAILENVAVRIDEMQGELDGTQYMYKIGLDTVDDDYLNATCDCPECRDDRSYRMD